MKTRGKVYFLDGHIEDIISIKTVNTKFWIEINTKFGKYRYKPLPLLYLDSQAFQPIYFKHEQEFIDDNTVKDIWVKCPIDKIEYIRLADISMKEPKICSIPNLKPFMTGLGINAKDVSNFTGIDLSRIKSYLDGDVRPTQKTIAHIAFCLGVDTELLMDTSDIGRENALLRGASMKRYNEKIAEFRGYTSARFIDVMKDKLDELYDDI